MSHSRVLATAILACAGISCAGSECPQGAGTVELHFTAKDIASATDNLTGGLIGPVHGKIFRPEHVNTGGPTPDAVAIRKVYVDHVDLTAEGESVESFSSCLSPGTYVFLGFIDLDRNAGDPALGDIGDLVTLPQDNDTWQFEVIGNEHTSHTVHFDFTLPCTVISENPPACVL